MEVKNKEHPSSRIINMSGEQWGEINRLCHRLGLDPYLYAETNSKKAGRLIFALSKCHVSGTHKFPIPNPEEYK